jgi:hypothetical protein
MVGGLPFSRQFLFAVEPVVAARDTNAQPRKLTEANSNAPRMCIVDAGKVKKPGSHLD